MKILKFMAENVKRIKAVEITPSGALVVIGGKNDAGKSSTLDAIEMALGGKGSMPTQPVRKGQKSARVRLELGESVEIGPELTVRLIVTASGGRDLVVQNREGVVVKSPQAVLDRLYNALTFDPLAFEREDDRVQAEILRQLVGLDVSDLDQQRDKAYEERTGINRDHKAAQYDVENSVRHPAIPSDAAAIAIRDLLKELEEAEQIKKKSEKATRDVYDAEKRAMDHDAFIKRHIDQVRTLQQEIKALQEMLEVAESQKETIGDDVAFLRGAAIAIEQTIPNTAAIRKRIADAETHNRKIAENEKYREAEEWAEKLKAQAQALTARIAAIDAEKTARLAAVTFPVQGLGLDENGVTFQGIPFNQASSSMRTLVSMSIAIAKNPELKVALVRDGSLIGQDRLKEIAQIAEATGSQVWIEIMQEEPNARTTVYIEDGAVVDVAATT